MGPGLAGAPQLEGAIAVPMWSLTSQYPLVFLAELRGLLVVTGPLTPGLDLTAYRYFLSTAT